MPRLPKKLTRGDKFATEWNAMVDYLQSLRPIQSSTTLATHTLRGVIREAYKPGVGISGWRWASPRTYDKTKSYAPNQIVVVLPTNTVVVDGHTDPDTEELVYTPAGLWVCLKSPRVAIPETDPVEYAIHTPQWPTPTPDDPEPDEAPFNYWWPISFYPQCF